MLSNKISKNIRHLRLEKNYSLEKLARLADLSLNTIVKIEGGTNKNPTIKTLVKIADAFEININRLIH